MVTPRIIILCNRLLSEGFLTSEGLQVLGEAGLALINAALLDVGHRLRFIRTIDAGITQIDAGETAVVVTIGEGLGAAYIKLDQEHEGLLPYGNTLALLPLVNTETIEALEVIA